MSDYLDPANEELLKDFFVEAELQVEALESNILVLESNPGNADAIDEIFRAAHTLKGGAATVQMQELTEFTHLLEDTLDGIRGGAVTVLEDTVDRLLASVDVIKTMLEHRQAGDVFSGDVRSVTDGLRAILTGTQPASAPAGPTISPPAPVPTTDAQESLSEYELLELKQSAEVAGGIFRVTVTFREDNPMNTVGGIQVYALLKNLGQVLKTIPDFDELYEDRFHPRVVYFVASEADVAGNRERFSISDVTDVVTVDEIDAVASSAAASSAASTTKEPTREAPAKPAEVDAVSDPGPSVEPEPTAEEPAAASDTVATEHRRPGGQGSILRVDSRRIDSLLNLVSETVITKAAFNQVTSEFGESLSALQSAETRNGELLHELFDALTDAFERAAGGEPAKELKRELLDRFSELPEVFDGFQATLKGTVGRFRNNAQNLGRIAGELQEGVMRIRMVPISTIFSRFPRLVRDLSRSLDKKLDLEIEGEDTELDKSVIEDLLDPLIHCVRNSIDHGIEDVETRRATGKPETGMIALRASNEGNMILIEIADDGGGIDVASVRKKAVERGLIHQNKQLSDIEAFNLIFDPGFSTAKKVTNISGRGVGLDVVKRQIERLNGSVTVWSEHGVGTRFTIKIPLTLAIIQGLLVRVGEEVYAIPITSVIDSHRIRPSEIKMIDNYEVFNVREDVVSLLRLSRVFRIPVEENPEYHYVVIVGTAERKMGLIVDSLVGEEDVVIKPLRDHFTNSPGIAGANITGDGRVSLIIDVSQLLELGLRQEQEARARREMTVGAR